jgi:hypothetical protein
MLWFLFPGMAEQVSAEDDWAFFRRWAWDGVRLGQDPDLDRAGRRPVRPGALVAGLTWYRANSDPARFVINNPTRVPVPAVAVPRCRVVQRRLPLTEAQTTGSGRFVAGPSRYERLDGVDHWVPVHAPERLNELLVDFLG